ncbi:C-4 sterol methyl oxidase [Yamadazyma tenuis]|uniref:Uncharacterized protein ERG25 n=1 Tax=Candida tenuis (strain ATCC 10573 / BCRC 21748 / CBS 615 / JCM 9827 / NBRC 10315 / NRRL Y-1498 / VKM Y-70) TaxID=590646 RepID=G3B8Q5_CANTC|nr:uncharacterized protein CANTEDRAFT_109226 [Yamadazyma tenuis ATCC 10573]EGV62905.1 hypothetical protein CANTEDRAFT_109226 [Yamadazyma tenuis ATCC 10573]WEJ93679.1 C-4 sterol methyl oxidase [Yamadazyma tenuis]
MFNETSSLAYLSSAYTFPQILQDLKSTDLNYMESLWASWYIYFGNDIFATGLLFFLTHELMYFGRCIPWFIIDRIPYFNQWKIQPTKIPSNKEQWECCKLVFKQHLLVEALPIWLFHPLCSQLSISISVPFPSWKIMLAQISFFFFVEDIWHYTFHRIFHYGIFYKYVHKQHHRYAAPFGFAAEYAHPIEVMALGFGTVGFPIVYAYTALSHKQLPPLHLFTICIWITLRLFQAVDSHSGYDFPWSLNKFVPFWAGAEHHDEHHHFFIGNYASSFRWCDAIMKTECGMLAKQRREMMSQRKAESKYRKRD